MFSAYARLQFKFLDKSQDGLVFSQIVSPFFCKKNELLLVFIRYLFEESLLQQLVVIL
jgi:hypothetical protein